jgi:hypothetical protein
MSNGKTQNESSLHNGKTQKNSERQQNGNVGVTVRAHS